MQVGGIGENGAATVGEGDGVNLRAWFWAFLVWLAVLTAAACWGLAEVERHGSVAGWTIWVLAGYAFYLSLCCTFLPAPTTWIVMLAASDIVAAQVGLEGYAAGRLVAVSSVGAAATGLANLNEYHLVVYLMRKRRVAKVRDTRLFRAASGWFHTNPFWILAMFSFLPVPVDVIRWLAMASRYSRIRFFWANFLGRWLRYAICAAAAMGLGLSTTQIVAIQGVLVAAALVRIIPKVVRRGAGWRDDGSDVSPGPDEPPSTEEIPVVAGDVRHV